jgi:hypothetical protein
VKAVFDFEAAGYDVHGEIVEAGGTQNVQEGQ